MQEESELSKHLRAFIISMDDTYGDGTSLELAKKHTKELIEALNRYSHDRFVEYSKDDFITELIIDALLCNDDNNVFIRDTKRLVAIKQSAERVYKEIKGDKKYRDALISSYIKRATIPYHTKIEGVKPRIMEMIQKISSYQLSKKEEEKKVRRKKAKAPFKKLSFE